MENHYPIENRRKKQIDSIHIVKKSMSCVSILLVFLQGCDKPDDQTGVINDILQKAYYTFRYEIDSQKCFPPFGSELKYCVFGKYHFYDPVIVHNEINVDVFRDSHKVDSLRSMIISEQNLNLYRDVEVRNVAGKRPDDLRTGYLHFDLIKLYEDSILVDGSCRGNESFLNYRINFVRDSETMQFSLDTVKMYVY